MPARGPFRRANTTTAEDPLAAAQREFAEETGLHLGGEFRKLAPRKQRSGKVVHAWALEAEVDVADLRSNTFTIEWPPRSGITAEFPEVDRGEWFAIATAMQKINAGQRGFLEELQDLLTGQRSDRTPSSSADSVLAGREHPRHAI